MVAAPRGHTPPPLDDLLTTVSVSDSDTWPTLHDAPDAERRWRATLQDDDPMRRGTAVRLMALEGSAASIDAIRNALGSETDAHVRAELARALVVLGTAADDRDALDALRRVDPTARRRTLATLAAVRPASLVGDVRRAGARSVVVSELGSVLDTLFAAGSPQAEPLMVAVALRPDTAGVAQLLAAAARWDRDVPAEALETALHEAALVPAALAYLALHEQQPAGQGVARRADGGARVDAAADAVPRTAEDVVLFALRDRWRGMSTRVDLRAALAGLRDGSAVYTLPDEVFRVLTRDERRVLEQRFDMTSPVRALLARVGSQRQPRGADAARRHPVRLLTDLPSGLPAALRAITGCASSAPDDRVATILYTPDGRPADIRLDDAALSEACRRYVQAMARLAWGPVGLDPHQPARMVIRVGDAGCDTPGRRPVLIAAGARELAADLARPRRVVHRAPLYPRDVRARRVEGTVLVDTRIDEAGCVASAQVIGGLDPALDVEAVRALSSWRYAPATLDGTPVPVQMDVAVQFVLK